MKKTATLLAVAGIAMGTSMEDIQDNNLILDRIKNGYYDATNWALRNPVLVNKGIEYGVKYGPTVYHGTKSLLGFDEVADNEMYASDDVETDDFLALLEELIKEVNDN